MQDEIWHQFVIQNYNGNVLSVYSVGFTVRSGCRVGEVPSYVGFQMFASGTEMTKPQ